MEERGGGSMGGERRKARRRRRRRQGRKREAQEKVVFFSGDCKYDSVKDAAQELGWKLMEREERLDKCNVIWVDVASINQRLEGIKPWQRINHFPGMTNIARKSRLYQSLTRMQRMFPREYSFFPRTWVLPQEFADFRTQFDSQGRSSKVFILKPDSGCQGRGIFLTSELSRIPQSESMVAQQYIRRPLLIDNFKFDLRLYILVSSCKPLRMYMFHDGLVRLCTEEYVRPTQENLSDRCMHLTNYAVNKLSDKFQANEDADRDDVGSKRSLRWFMQWIAEERGEKKARQLWKRMGTLAVRVVISVLPTLIREYDSTFGTTTNFNEFAGEQTKRDEQEALRARNRPIRAPNAPSATSTPGSTSAASSTASTKLPRLRSEHAGASGVRRTSRGSASEGTEADGKMRERRNVRARTGSSDSEESEPAVEQSPNSPSSDDDDDDDEDDDVSSALSEEDTSDEDDDEKDESDFDSVLEDQDLGEGSDRDGAAVDDANGEGARSGRRQSWQQQPDKVPKDVSGSRCFEILGIDVLLDHALKPWLIEINHLPSFATDAPLDHNIKSRVVGQTLRSIPVRGSDARKHNERQKWFSEARLLGGANRSTRKRSNSESAAADFVRREIEKIYEEHAPEKLEHLDTLMEKCKGNETKLLRAVVNKYVVNKGGSGEEKKSADTENDSTPRAVDAAAGPGDATYAERPPRPPQSQSQPGPTVPSAAARGPLRAATDEGAMRKHVTSRVAAASNGGGAGSSTTGEAVKQPQQQQAAGRKHFLNPDKVLSYVVPGPNDPLLRREERYLDDFDCIFPTGESRMFEGLVFDSAATPVASVHSSGGDGTMADGSCSGAANGSGKADDDNTDGSDDSDDEDENEDDDATGDEADVEGGEEGENGETGLNESERVYDERCGDGAGAQGHPTQSCGAEAQQEVGQKGRARGPGNRRGPSSVQATSGRGANSVRRYSARSVSAVGPAAGSAVTTGPLMSLEELAVFSIEQDQKQVMRLRAPLQQRRGSPLEWDTSGSLPPIEGMRALEDVRTGGGDGDRDVWRAGGAGDWLTQPKVGPTWGAPPGKEEAKPRKRPSREQTEAAERLTRGYNSELRQKSAPGALGGAQGMGMEPETAARLARLVDFGRQARKRAEEAREKRHAPVLAIKPQVFQFAEFPGGDPFAAAGGGGNP